jgi:hypothetical protein
MSRSMSAKSLQVLRESCDDLRLDSFAKRASAALAARGKNKQWLAEVTGINQPTISRTLNPRVDPTTGKLRGHRPSSTIATKIAKALGVSVEWLNCETSDPGALGETATGLVVASSEIEAVINLVRWPAELSNADVIEILERFRQESAGLPRAYLIARLEKFIAERL